ncbi:MAG TPA: POTRA domain-containing protein [Vicinamibacterales bacterium]
MRRPRPLLALLLLALFRGAANAAVVDYIGKPIGTVRLVIEGRNTTDPLLIQVVETRVGEPLSMAQVRDTVTHLFSLGRFEDVRVDASLDAGAVALRYELSPVHPVTKVTIDAPVKAAGIDAGRLRRALADRYGGTPAVGRAADMSRTLEETLAQLGYVHAHVTPHAELAHDPDRATLVFRVEPGARTEIGSIEVVGTPSLPAPELLKQLRVAKGVPYERDALAARIESYVEGRRRKGYYEAKLTPAVQLTDGDRVAHLTLTVDPGPHVRVVFTGDPLPSDKRADLVPVEREGSADEDMLEDSSNRIEEYFRAQGYRDAAAPHTRESSDGELSIAFNINKGRLYRLAGIEISGNASMPLADFAAALREHEGEPFSSAKVDADVSTIEDAYRRRGFPAARAQSAVSVPPAAAGAAAVPVTVRIVVTEGARTVVGSVTIEGNRAIPDAQLRPPLRLQPGAPYFESLLAADRDAVAQSYQNLGYQSATVDAAPNYSADRTRVDPVLTVHEGPQIFVDHILIVGNVRTNAATIEQALKVKTGDPLSTSAINEAQARLAGLGLFRRTIINELPHGGANQRDLLVTVEEAPASTIGYGGGFEVQEIVPSDAQGAATTRLEFAPRASFELGRRNLFGKNRSANLFASVAEHLNDLPTEYQLLGTYREPHLFDTAADAFITATIEQVHRTSFNFKQKSATATVARHLTRDVSASVSYQIQKTDVFDEKVTADQLLIDRVFANVLLSSFSGSVIRDNRSDAIDPRAGEYVSANAQVAGRSIGSAVGFAKSFFTAETFRTLPHSNGIVFAADARLGLATGFPQQDATGATIRDLPPSERFYAGGDTTVRGFALDTLGVRHTPPLPADTIDANGFPTGGNALVILNAELRAPVWGGLGVVGFVDTGNVFARAVDIDLGLVRTAVGFGIRYKSPIGPLRIDLGFKVHPQTFGLGQREPLTALHISLGQAF